MAWLAITWEPLWSMIALHNHKTAKKGEAIFKDQQHPMVQILFSS